MTTVEDWNAPTLPTPTSYQDNNQKENVNESDVCCDIQGKRQTYRNSRVSKGREEKNYTKYICGGEQPGDCCPQPCAPPQCCPPPRNTCDSMPPPMRNTCDSKPAPPRKNFCDANPMPFQKSEPKLCPRPPKCGEKEKLGKVCDPDYHFNDTDYADELCHFPDNTKTLPPNCYEVPLPRKCQPCTKKTKWQNAKYCRDDCGSGIVPLRYNYHISRRIWCRTPLTTYQASHGELGRQILCREKEIKRLINDGPPCNICEYILPPCRGYYKQYDCVRPCADESENIVFRDGRNRMRDRVERYWESCFSAQAKQDVNTYAPQNMALAIKFRKKAFGGTGAPCW